MDVQHPQPFQDRKYIKEKFQHSSNMQQDASQVAKLLELETNTLPLVSTHKMKELLAKCAPPALPELTREDGVVVIDVEDVYETEHYPTMPMQSVRPEPVSDKIQTMPQTETWVQLTFVRDDLKHFYCPIETLLEKAQFAYYKTYQDKCANPDDALPERMKVSWWNWIKASNKLLHMRYPIYIGWVDNKTVICEGRI